MNELRNELLYFGIRNTCTALFAEVTKIHQLVRRIKRSSHDFATTCVNFHGPVFFAFLDSEYFSHKKEKEREKETGSLIFPKISSRVFPPHNLSGIWHLVYVVFPLYIACAHTRTWCRIYWSWKIHTFIANGGMIYEEGRVKSLIESR